MAELTYKMVGDYRIPDLTLGTEDSEEAMPLGKYGRMRESFLEEHHSGIYTEMLLMGGLDEHLRETDQRVYEMMDRLVAEMAVLEGVNEALKAADQMAWVGQMNNIRNRAEEIVLSEVIYS